MVNYSSHGSMVAFFRHVDTAAAYQNQVGVGEARACTGLHAVLSVQSEF